MSLVVGMKHNNDGRRMKSKGISGRLPPVASLRFGRVCVLCRKRPRVQGRKGDQSIHITDGVLIPGTDVSFEGREIDGNLKILDRDLQASRIEVKPQKARGSRNHHKFMVILTNGMVS